MGTIANGEDHDTRGSGTGDITGALMARYLPDAILLVHEGIVTWASAAIEDITGSTPQEVVGEALADLLHPDDGGALTVACASAQAGGREFLMARLRVNRGSYTAVDLWLRAYDESAEYGGLVVAVRTATHALGARGEALAIEGAVRALAERAGDVLWVVDGVGTVLDVGPAIHDILAWHPDEVVGTSALSLIHPDDLPALQVYRSAVQAGTARGSIALRARARGGGFRWVRATALVLTTPGSTSAETTRVLMSWRDIDSLVRETRFAERESQRLRAILDVALDPWLMLTPVRDHRGDITDFIVEDANAGAADYLRWPRERLVGTRLLREFPAVASEGLMSAYIDAMDSGEPMVIHDFAYPHELFGEDRRYELRALAAGGSLMLTWRDTTPASRARDELAANEAFFRAVASSAGDVLVVLDDGRVQWASSSAAAMGLVGGSGFEGVMRGIVVPDSTPQVRTCCTLLEGGHPYTGRWHRPSDVPLLVRGRTHVGSGRQSVVIMIEEEWTHGETAP